MRKPAILSRFSFCIAFCSALPLLVLADCAPIDQRFFNPDAGQPPKPYIPVKTVQNNVNRPAAFLQIIEGTPEEDYGPAIDSAVKIALQRKRNILFIVQGLAPMQDTSDAQAKALVDLTENLATPVAARILKAGAAPVQIEMQAATDPAIHQAMVRVNVR